MSNQTPTPETDAVSFPVYIGSKEDDSSCQYVAPICHARRLERERDEARDELANEQKRSDCVSGWYEDEVEAHAKTRAEVARLREALEAIASYGKEGICPYGCDTPHIATETLAAVRGEEEAK
jgi:hypothetical protein